MIRYKLFHRSFFYGEQYFDCFLQCKSGPQKLIQVFKMSPLPRLLLRKFQKGYSEIAVVAACWGILLTSVAFVTIIASPGNFQTYPDRQEHVTLRIFCLAAILCLGCIQSVFSILLALAPKNRRFSYDSAWVYIHILVAIFLAAFLILNAYFHGTLISEGKTSKVTALDITAIFDLLFILVLVIILVLDDTERHERNFNNILIRTAERSTENPYAVVTYNDNHARGANTPNNDNIINNVYTEAVAPPLATISATVENIYAEPYETVLYSREINTSSWKHGGSHPRA